MYVSICVFVILLSFFSFLCASLLSLNDNSVTRGILSSSCVACHAHVSKEEIAEPSAQPASTSVSL